MYNQIYAILLAFRQYFRVGTKEEGNFCYIYCIGRRRRSKIKGSESEQRIAHAPDGTSLCYFMFKRFEFG